MGSRAPAAVLRVAAAAGAAGLAAVYLGACGGSEPESAESPTRTSAGPATITAERTTTETEPATTEAEVGVALVPTPEEALRACRGSARLRPACPRLVPEAPYEERPEVFVAEVLRAGGGSPEAFNLQWGAENPARPDRNRPPSLSHVVIVAAARDGALRGIDARVLRRAEWSGREGTLLRAAGFPRGGLHGDHLVFRWQEGRREYAASLHAWEPFHETVATLEAIVASMPSR